jgi:hypothetical protein
VAGSDFHAATFNRHQYLNFRLLLHERPAQRPILKCLEQNIRLPGGDCVHIDLIVRAGAPLDRFAERAPSTWWTAVPVWVSAPLWAKTTTSKITVKLSALCATLRVVTVYDQSIRI